MNIIKLFFIGVVTAILNKLQTLLAYIDNHLINLTLKIMDREREEDEQQQQHEQQEQGGGEQAAAAEQQQRLQGDRQLYMDIMDHDFDSDDDDEDFEIEEAQGDFSDNELEDDDNEEEGNEDDADDDDDDSEDTETEAEDGDEAMSVEEIRAYTVSGIRSHLYKGSSIYTFKPLRLIRCYFTMRNSKDNHNALPISRSGHRVIASESHLYSLGGYNPRSATISERLNQCQLFQELWSFNFATNRWKLVLSAKNTTNIPKELASTALVIYNNVLISHGGTGYPFGEICSNDCYAYSVSDNKPSVTCLKVTGDLPTAQYGPGIVIHKNYLYTIGGTTGYEYSCDVFRLDLTTKKWENVYICRPEMRDDPEGRYRHEVVYDGTHIYVLGGGTSLSVYDLKRLPAFNLNTNTWDYFDTLPDRSVLQVESSHSVQAGYPKPRKCFSCVQHKQSNGDIEAFIAGGLQADFKTYFADIWKLNLRTKQWTLIRTATLPKPLYFHSAAHAGNGCMYIFGGIEYSKKDMRRRNHLYKMWMTIPKLSEMCWDAITYYNENLNCFDMSTLLREGIPKEYLKRLPPQEKTFPRNSESTVFKTCAISTSMEQN